MWRRKTRSSRATRIVALWKSPDLSLGVRHPAARLPPSTWLALIYLPAQPSPAQPSPARLRWWESALDRVPCPVVLSDTAAEKEDGATE
jgi:hypothetical protein